MEHHWNSTEIPNLENRNAVVTGAGREIGQLIIRRLQEHGANVYAISRDDISSEEFGPNVEPVRINPTSMESIQHGASRILHAAGTIDILIHAASISVAPRFRSRDGHNLMLATNYLGFVLLSHELSPALRRSDSPRVVLAGPGTPVSIDVNLDQLDGDLDWDIAYAQTRLAAMMFALELSVRAKASNTPLISAVGEARESDRFLAAHHPIRRMSRNVVSRLTGVPRDAAALPVLFAATSEFAEGGSYYAPETHGRLRGEPLQTMMPQAARSESLRAELWQRTEDMLGVSLAIA